MNVIMFAIGILSGSLGAFLMKIGASHMGDAQLGSFSQAVSYVLRLLTNPLSLGGMGLYFFSAVVWSYLLIKLDISFVQPILALTYILTPLLAMFFLSERVSTMRWVGIAIIIVGVFVVARTAA